MTSELRGTGVGMRVLAGIALAAACLLLGPGTGAGAPVTVIYTLAGTGGTGYSGDGGPGVLAQLDAPRSVAPTADGGFLVAQPFENVVRKVGPDGKVTTVAGTGTAGYSGDGGQATSAQLNFVHGAAPLPGGGFVLADALNNAIRRVWPDGTITTVAGTGVAGYSGDGGPAKQAQINNPRGVATLPDGGFLIPDTNNHRVRRVWPDGTITTVAGTGVQGFTGDGGQATNAQLSIPFSVTPMADGGFLVDDVGNQRIRRVYPDGTINTVAGTGVSGYSGDGGPATAAATSNVHNIWATADGGYLIADASNSRIRRVSPSGIITTVAGTGTPGFSGDGGSPTAAAIAYPKAVAEDASGNLLIADTSNNRIRIVGPPAAPSNAAAPSISGTPQNAQPLNADPGTWAGTPPFGYAYQWRRCDAAGANCADISGANGSSYTPVPGDVGSAMRVVVTASNTAGSSSATSAATAAVAAAGSVTTTFGVSSSGDDGDVGASGSAYPPSGAPAANVAGTTVTAGRRWVSWAGFSVYTALMRFDTSALPDGASITSAKLRIYVTAKRSPDNLGFSGEWYNASAWPIDAADWTATPSETAFAALPISGIGSGATNDVTLQNVGTISTTGYSALRLHVSGGQPVGDNIVQIASSDNATLPKPQLVVTYTTGSSGGGAPSATAPPAISGTAAAGSTLTVNNPPGTWTNSPTAYAYQWQSSSSSGGTFTDIAGATGSSYTLARSDADRYVRVFVTAGNGSGTGTASSSSLGPVTAPPQNSVPPSVSGNAQQGQSLTASTGTWSGSTPITYAYVWQRCDGAGANCAAIGGASASTYTLAAGDVGATIRVLVTATNSAGSANGTSAQTAVVAGPPAAPRNTAPPTISGTPREGQVLAADPGSWTGTPPLSYAYQWQRCDSGGAACVPIAGATSTSYTVAPADVGATIRVKVIASNAAGSAYASAVVADGPKSYWRMDDASGALTDSQGFKSGSYVNGPQRAVNGLITADPDTAVSLNGTSQYLDIPADAAWTPSAFSLELTLRPSSLPDNRTIWSTMGFFTGWWLNTNTLGQVRMFIGDGSDWRALNSGFALNAGSTYHVVVTYDGTNARLYINGALISTGPSATMAQNVGGSVMRFGEGSTGPGQFWPGALDDASFYSFALTSTQVQSHYQASSAADRTAVSGATAVVTSAAPQNSSPPTIAGTAQQGQVLTASNGTWSGSAPIAYGYQWQRCDSSGANCVAIAGATGTTYTLDVPDVGTTVRVAVTASNAAGSQTATSAATAVVTSAAPQNSSPPTIAGTAQQGQVLTASNGTWSGATPIAYGYQWQRCDGSGGNCSVIAGATGSTYMLGASDVGATIRVAVTASNGAGSQTATSSATSVVAPPPAAPQNTSPPTISGTAQSGSTLTAAPGTWTGTAPISYAYQWRRCDSGGANCADVPGATGSTYALAGADVGSTVRVAVTGSNGVGSGSAVSAPSGVVASAPVTVTFSVATAADDGDIGASSTAYPPTGTPAANSSGTTLTAGRRWVSWAGFGVYVGLMRFNTSPLPDGATVTSAKLRLYVTSRRSADGMSFTGEWYDAANWPIDALDWTATPASTAFSPVPILGITEQASDDFTLQNLGSISTTGFTGVRLHVSGGQPTADNLVQMASWDHATLPEPQLVVTYTTG